jgi:predicted phage terminase large subunit-like protein
VRSAQKPPSIQLRALQAVSKKKLRAIQRTLLFESGSWLFPKEVPWLADLTHELLAVPNGRHDDQVDGIIQVLTWLARHFDCVVRAAVFPSERRR